MFSQSLCRICERAGDWRYKEEREEEYFSLLFTDLPVEWIPKLNNFSSVPLQLAVTTDDYKETHAIKQPLKPVLKAQTRKDTCAYGCPTITFSSINSVKMFCHRVTHTARVKETVVLYTQWMERKKECLSGRGQSCIHVCFSCWTGDAPTVNK